MNTLEKAALILQIIAARGSVTPKELAQALGLSKSATYRLILSLSNVHLVARAQTGEGVVLGPLIGELAGGPVKAEQLMHTAQPHMAALRDRCGETVGLNVLQGGRRIVLGQEVSRHEHQWVYKRVMVPRPLHAGAASKMLLAALPRADAEKLLSAHGLALLAPNTPHDRNGLLDELDRTRTQGYAVSLQEFEPGVASIAVPVEVNPAQGLPPVVLSIIGPSQRLSETVLKGLLPQMREAADRIASDTGAMLLPLQAAS